MNVISIVSLCIAFLSFVFSTIWNTVNAKRSRDKDYRDLIETMKIETREKSEMQVLFREMNKNLERIVEDNKVMNERIYNLAERLALLEHDQQKVNDLVREIPVIDNKADKAHQRIDIVEHSLKKSN